MVPVLPGIYPAVAGPVRLPYLQLGGFFLRSFDNKALAPRYNDAKRPTLLFSFVGNVNYSEVRRQILALKHPDALLLNRSSGARDARLGLGGRDDAVYFRLRRDSSATLISYSAQEA